MFVAALCSFGAAALAGQPRPADEAAELTRAIEETLAGGGEQITPPRTRLPSGEYTLCTLSPALIYRNMVGGAQLPRKEAESVYRGWIEHLRGISAALVRSGRRYDTANLNIRATLDRDIRARIGESGVSEPDGPAMTHYQALIWSTSCVIDRANTRFVRRFLARRPWPSGKAADGPSHSLFLLIQHAVLTAAEGERLVPRIEDAFRKGAIDPFDYARLVDRSTQSRLRFQKYGTQISILDGRRVVEGAVGCRATLDESRRAIGLAPLDPDLEIRLQSGEPCREPR